MRSTICSTPVIPEAMTMRTVWWVATLVAIAAVTMLSRVPSAVDTGIGAATRIPESPDSVVLQLGAAEGTLRRLAALRHALDASPKDPDAASRYARLALEHYAITGDARYLGLAGGGLQPWANDAAPPEAIWLLRGRILQTEHRFREAAAELDRMHRAYPDSVEALLLAADAWRRAGAIGKAKARCAGVALAGREDLARLCAADILLSLGDAEQAWKVASSNTATAADAVDVVRWALTIRADAAAAVGRAAVAESLYRDALALPGAGIALRVSHADLLLQEGRPREALDALAALPEATAVTLRRAIAARRLGLPAFADYRTRLLQDFSTEEALGADFRHLREKAMFELYVERDAAAALGLAARNWRLQKGTEDAAILVRSALAAGRADAARDVSAWRQRFHAEVG